MNKRKHIHLGERLAMIQEIRGGRRSVEEAAASLDVPADEVLHWMQIHSEDRIYELDEARVSPEAKRLSRRAERLVELIAAADVTIRVLNRMLAEGVPARGA
jgi:hypothetical protein